jgi:hypothetical protein
LEKGVERSVAVSSDDMMELTDGVHSRAEMCDAGLDEECWVGWMWRYYRLWYREVGGVELRAVRTTGTEL